MKGQAFPRRMGFALQGLKRTIRLERSFRTHLAAGGAVLLIALLTRPPAIWWAILALAVGFVLVTELLNTALETLVDHTHPEPHPAIGAVKDVAAGAVLVAVATAVGVGIAFLVHWVST